jgi:hypothetical protein
MARQITIRLLEGQNQLRYDLPVIEGIATDDYWEEQVKRSFSLPSETWHYHKRLTDFDLQDRFPAFQAFKALKSAEDDMRQHLLDPDHPTVVYVEDPTGNQASKLAQLGDNPLSNNVVVMANDQGDPVIAALRDSHLTTGSTPVSFWDAPIIVTAPGKRGQIVSLEPGSPEAGELERAEHVANRILQVEQQLEQNVSATVTGNHLKNLYHRWKALAENVPHTNKDDLINNLHRLTGELSEITRAIPAAGLPNLAKQDESNVKKAVKLAMLMSMEKTGLPKLPFRTADGTNTRPVSQPPGIVLVGEMDKPGERVDLYLDRLTPEGNLSGQEVTLKDIPSNSRYRAAAYAALKMSPDNPVLGRKNPVEKSGYETMMLSSDKKHAISSGHWMSENELLQATMRSPIALVYNDVSGQPLFRGDPSAKSGDETAMKMEASIYLLHGRNVDHHEAVWAAELARHDGEFLLEINVDDVVGSPKLDIPDCLFAIASDDDLKLHLSQRVAVSDIEQSKKMSMIEKIRQMSWGEADTLMEEAFRSTEQQEPALGM